MARHGLFVTGTGTGVGKSVVSASVVAALAASGKRVGAFKPVVTGLDEPDTDWPMDHVLLAGATGWQDPAGVTPITFGPAVSPHLAAELAGKPIDPQQLIAAYEEIDADVVICEGVGGLMVPFSLDPPFDVLDLAKRLALPVIVAADPDLGTINHTRLTVERLRGAGLDVPAVVLSGWPDEPTVMQRSNRETIGQVLDIEVHGLPRTTPEALAEAGAGLPVERWISGDGATA